MSKLSGFTPVIDIIVEKHGLMAALVFGIIWRHCQESQKKCYASQGNMAKIIGISRKTFNETVAILVRENYLMAEKSDGKTVTYYDTGKIQAAIRFEETSEEPVTENDDMPVTQSYNTCNPELHKDTSIKHSEISLDKSKDISRTKRRPRDPRFDHPAIKAYREITELSIRRINLDTVILALGEEPDRERVTSVFGRWCELGFNPTNMSWLQWYKSGIPEKYQPKRIDRREYRHTDGLVYWHYPDGRTEVVDEKKADPAS